MKNIFINSKRYFAIAIGFLFLISFIPYLNYNVYGQTTVLITGSGQTTVQTGPVIVNCPPNPPIVIGSSTINFDATGTSNGQVIFGNFQESNSVTGGINGQISGGTVDPSGFYILSGQLTNNMCPSMAPIVPFSLQGTCSVNEEPVPIRLSSSLITGTYLGVVDCNPPNTTDSDNDGVEDTIDNCPLVANQDQADLDGDGTGDACDADRDGDDILDNVDNCPLVANPNQEDNDSDNTGDACDRDDDNDDVFDDNDNCPFVANSNQSDTDLDGKGDACDNDDDNDTVNDDTDNCQFVANPGQINSDNDSDGDACDNDDDNDTVNDDTDNCQFVANLDQKDFDEDGIGDACDNEIILTDVFKNQGQCIAFVNNNSEYAGTLGITKEKCQAAAFPQQ